MVTRLERIAAIWVLLALFAGLLIMARAAAGSDDKVNMPIVTVIRHGGLCVSGTECRFVLRVTDTSVMADGYVTRRLSRLERATLLRAIDRLDLAMLRRHPFKGTCPTAYDGTESIYRFRGFAYPLAACTYDLQRVPAVRLVEALLATLRPR